MSIFEIIAGSLMILSCIIIIIAVSLQSGKGGGGLTSVIMGGSDGGSRGKGKEADAKLARVTKWLAGIVFVVAIVINILVLI